VIVCEFYLDLVQFNFAAAILPHVILIEKIFKNRTNAQFDIIQCIHEFLTSMFSFLATEGH